MEINCNVIQLYLLLAISYSWGPQGPNVCKIYQSFFTQSHSRLHETCTRDYNNCNADVLGSTWECTSFPLTSHMVLRAADR